MPYKDNYICTHGNSKNKQQQELKKTRRLYCMNWRTEEAYVYVAWSPELWVLNLSDSRYLLSSQESYSNRKNSYGGTAQRTTQTADRTPNRADKQSKSKRGWHFTGIAWEQEQTPRVERSASRSSEQGRKEERKWELTCGMVAPNRRSGSARGCQRHCAGREGRGATATAVARRPSRWDWEVGAHGRRDGGGEASLSALFDSLDASYREDSPERHVVEQQLLSREIQNVLDVGGPGAGRRGSKRDRCATLAWSRVGGGGNQVAGAEAHNTRSTDKADRRVQRQHDWRRRGGRRNLLLGIHGDGRDRGARAGPGGTRRSRDGGAARLPVKSPPRTLPLECCWGKPDDGESGIARNRQARLLISNSNAWVGPARQQNKTSRTVQIKSGAPVFIQRP
jgi:hypothetical protein